MTTKTSDIRQTFLDYFVRNDHTVVPSSALVPHNDPTLMFSNAGMNQFKNVFTGAEKRPYNRAVSSQKCVRAGGKHNDLDNVGYTARHHTFFEMLGNFSFGNYFKEGAINFAWELLTKDYGFDKNKLWVTVYHTDDEAFNLWKKVTGFADERIIRITTNDNFWSMGDTGPCGPCSEIFYDHGDKIWGGLPGTPEQDGDRFVELWNLVFMQYEQVDKDTRINLPKPSIDTGSGLERVAAAMQGVTSNYDIDLFKALIRASEEFTKTKAVGELQASHRVIADHLRASGFLIADGVMPSNEGRGYVLRRIMRRAMRYAHQLGCKDPLMYKLVPALVAEMGGQYPELVRAQATITDNLRLEEERFKQTLERGLKLLEEETAKMSGNKLPGEAAFKLYDTYGFPLDLTQDILRGQKKEVDLEGFEKAMNEQRERARAAWSGSGEKATGKIWFELKEKIGSTEFLGYAQDDAAGNVIAIVKDSASVTKAAAGDKVFIVLNQTPFYGESGGQVGDTGHFLVNKNIVADITDTKKPLENFIIHEAVLKASLAVGDVVDAVIDTDERNEIRANHSATHILHAVLRHQLGEHISQKGSLVDADRLRFDISHPKAVSKEELAAAEKEVNRIVAQATPVSTKLMTPDDAIKAGAMALFGEKYGDEVRVLSMGADGDLPYSVELCGGTHVRSTGDIGLFKIVSEGSVASGIRRIEAVTGEGVRGYCAGEFDKLNEQLQKLAEENLRLQRELVSFSGLSRESIDPRNKSEDDKNKGNIHLLSLEALGKASLKNLLGFFEQETAHAGQSIAQLQDDNKKLSKELAEAKKAAALGDSKVEVEKIGSVRFAGKIFEGLDPKELRGVAEMFLKEADVVFVGANTDGKASVVIAVSKDKSATISAVDLVKTSVEIVGGKGGGGKPEMAQGGGPDVSKLNDALNEIRKKLL